MKRVLSVVLQFVLFLAVFLVGSLLPGANLLPMISVGAGAFSNFQWIGPFNPGPFAQAVSCNVPASFEVNRLFTDYNDEIGA